MLTRLEVQGFKNLLDVRVDFGPFTCIAGANGIGKSNLFDAIELLSYLAEMPLAEAAKRVRGSSDPRDLFWNGYQSGEHQMSLAAEMIVPGEAWLTAGGHEAIPDSYLRYEVVLGLEEASGPASVGKLVIMREDLHPLSAASLVGSPVERLAADISSQSAARPLLTSRMDDSRLRLAYHSDQGPVIMNVPKHPKGHRTGLSMMIFSLAPSVWPARQEMLGWRRLALEPSALRAPDSFGDPRVLSTDGRYLAASLYRIAHEGSSDPDAVYARVAGRLADLGDTGVREVSVEPDEIREAFTLFLTTRDGMRLPARALSEGTLRFLALCVLLEDPDLTGLICMEEPENGIHPANLPAVVRLIQDLALDPAEPVDETNPFRQVIVNTHSPGVVQVCDPQDLLLAELLPQQAPDGSVTSALTLLPFKDSWRAASGITTFSEADIVPYLTAPSGTQLRLPSEWNQ
ncbi:AAA family ATPase [Longispora albida]|uniref:AAA family ATPase n=1 Tax=Longispora albida TaxID=203523 RepID=UPI000363B7DB|nr:AAA family ATPase [Longispora albida]